MRSDMESWKSIRQDVLVNGLSQRAACAKYKLGWHTLKRLWRMRSRRGIGRVRPDLGGCWRRCCRSFRRFRSPTRRPRRSSGIRRSPPGAVCACAPQRSFGENRRVIEYGYLGGKTVVEDAVRAWRQTHQEVFLPLVHPPGEAQVDFGEATIRQGGVERKVALFVMTLPYSRAAGGGLCLRTAASSKSTGVLDS